MSSVDDWRQLLMMCGGEGVYGHLPTPMMFERLGEGGRDGAIYRCPVCNGRKFVWRTLVRDNLSWEWKARPSVRSR